MTVIYAIWVAELIVLVAAFIHHVAQGDFDIQGDQE